MASPTMRSGPDPQAQGGVLPLPHDALYEILLRLSAKDLCLLRAVCWPWRCLLSDPHFIAAHSARHPAPPLVVAGYHTAYRNDGVVCDILDLSGNGVKRVRATGDAWVTSTHHDFICTSKGTSSCIRLLNLTTGAVLALPEELAEEHTGDERDISHYISVATFGRVASTGEYKVLRVLDRASFDQPEQLCEIITIDGSSHAWWRGKKAPPNPISLGRWKSVVVDGIVHFIGQDALLDSIASFDLEREEWRASLQGPRYQHYGTNELSLAAMNGSLVVVHRFVSNYMDLWFLVDFERGLWVKRHSILAELHEYISTVRPLLVLNDGRIVLMYIGSDRALLRIYNPGTNTIIDMAEMGHCFAVGLYPGSPLSLANCQLM